MRKLCFLSIMIILAGSVWAADVLVPASASCRTELLQPDTNRHDSSKLSIRSDASAAKSWIKFDISTLEDPNSIRRAVLRLTLHENEGDFQFDVSAVNDDCLDNIGWLEREITWNNAPANDTASWTNPDFTKATKMGTVDLTGNFNAGAQHFIDVTLALETDTDGIVQFILHNSNSLINCSTWDHPLGAEYYPTLIITFPPAGADWPNPEIDEIVDDALAALSWVNPDPNFPGTPITCDVYLGTEPNAVNGLIDDADMITLTPGVSSVAINTTNFPTHGSLNNDTTYYWFVDCHDPSREPALIPGEMWSFYVGQAPSVDAGPDQTVWLGKSGTAGQEVVSLDGTTSDDGPYTVKWTRVTNGAPEVTISPDDVDDTTVTFTQRGDYEFMLTATETGTEGLLKTFDTVRIVVGNDACDASHIETGDPYNVADYNQDCIVDILDFAELIADDWLNCTDTLTNCGN